MNSVIETILSRRSVRAFNGQPIPRNEMDQILRAAIYAPSGMNRQTWQFTAIVNQERISTLAKMIENKLNRPGYNFYKPSALVLTSNLKDSPWGMEDNACAMENMFLAAKSLGIGSVWINQMKDICEEPEVRAFLEQAGIPSNHTVYGVAALGYPKEEDTQVVQKKGIIKIIE